MSYTDKSKEELLAELHELKIAYQNDITERNLAEMALRETEVRMSAITESAKDAILMMDELGIISFWNQAAEKIFGYTSTEATKKNLHELIVPQRFHPAHDAAFPEFQKTGKGAAIGKTIEVSAMTKSGQEIEVELSLSSARINEKWHSVGIVRDITERKRTEEAFRRAEMKFHTLYDSTSDAVMLLDSNGFFDCNGATLKIFGVTTKEEFCSKHPGELSPQYQPDGVDSMTSSNQRIAMAIEKGSHKFEWTHKRYDTGVDFPAEVLLSAMELDGRQVLQAVVRNITERKLAELKLKESEEHLTAIYNIIGTGIILINSENHIIIDVNKAASKLIGLPPDEIIGQPCRKFICSNEVGQCPVRDYHQSVENCEKKLFTGDGKQKDIIKTVFPMKYKGMDCHLESFMDITEVKLKEEEITRANEELRDSNEIIETNLYQKNALIEELSEIKDNLEKINAEKDKFFSIIAHDLKSPFSGFLGLTKMMVDEFQDLSLKDMLTFSHNMRDSAKSLYKLLENLLEWSRIQRGVIEFNPEICFLPFIFKQNLDIQSEVAKQKEIVLVNNIPDHANVMADIPMLNTVIRNLMSNSIKFTPRGGRIEVGVQPEGTNTSEVCVYIKDNGLGMDSNMLGKLFKIDQKVSRPGTENEPSTGLGLLLCKEFIEKQGGKIWVESEEGKGSTFYFTLPKMA